MVTASSLANGLNDAAAMKRGIQGGTGPYLTRQCHRRFQSVCLCVGLLAVVTVAAQMVAVDPAFPAGGGPDNIVRALAVQADGRLLVGGSFSNLDGMTQPHLARLNPDGSLDNTFSIQIDNFPGQIVPLSDGRIFITGSFTNVNATARPGVAIVKADGALDP